MRDTIGDFQIWINDQRRAAATEAETRGWIALDAWLHQRVITLRKRYAHDAENLPLYHLTEDANDE